MASSSLGVGPTSSSSRLSFFFFDCDGWTPIGSPIDVGARINEISLSADSLTATVQFGSGRLSVYRLVNDAAWVPIGDVFSGAGSGSLSDDGSVLSVGFPGSQPESGRVVVYDIVDGSLVQRGGDIVGDDLWYGFGSKVVLSASGDTLVVGAPDAPVFFPSFPPPFPANPDKTGLIQAYKWDGSVWVKSGEALDPPSNFLLDFGRDFDLSADASRMVVGTNFLFNIVSDYKLQVFDRIGDNWTQVGQEFGSGSTVTAPVSITDDGSTITFTNSFVTDIGGGTVPPPVGYTMQLVDGEWTQVCATYTASPVVISGDGSTVALMTDFTGTRGAVQVYSTPR